MTLSGTSEDKVRTRKQLPLRLQQPEIEELLAQYQAGATIYELAAQFGIHRETVSNLLKRNGVRTRNRPLSPAQISEAIAPYQKAKSIAAVGASIGCDGNTVRLVGWRGSIRR
jgi:DNA-binding CsgD family transcriptional regulator